MQPASGGYLEAIPLTAFVVMSLAGTGRAAHRVARRGVSFLLATVRADGSWPIDTNLATWNTTLAVGALASATGDLGALGCLDWLLGCQHQARHPFTQAAPGGWGWNDQTGAVPDADDTAGALLALRALHRSTSDENRRRIETAVGAGGRWLLDLQNDDGGWPTFCRGWGALPFDRSGTDLTAHALRALGAWGEKLDCQQVEAALRRGFRYLEATQRDDGSWVPLWFGNQHFPGEENPLYGTAKVLMAFRDLGRMDQPAARRGLAFLRASQGPDGSFGAPPPAVRPADEPHPPAGDRGAVSSIEETGVALEALLAAGTDPSLQPAVGQAVRWLVEAVESGRHRQPSPIGLYFARLWYHETLYPLVFSLSALGHAVRRAETPSEARPQGDRTTTTHGRHPKPA
jgi:squalene-hopene/tetraprenyl-beta-curcumene cyclase